MRAARRGRGRTQSRAAGCSAALRRSTNASTSAKVLYSGVGLTRITSGSRMSTVTPARACVGAHARDTTRKAGSCGVCSRTQLLQAALHRFHILREQQRQLAAALGGVLWRDDDHLALRQGCFIRRHACARTIPGRTLVNVSVSRFSR
jgi:hypothetical protein